jgi:hypothetical protein
LLGDDVIDMEDQVWEGACGNVAVFAALVRSLSNKLASTCVRALIVRAIEAPGFGLHEANKLGIAEIRAVFGIFLRGQFAAIGLLAELFDAAAKLAAHFPIDELLRTDRREPTGVWV